MEEETEDVAVDESIGEGNISSLDSKANKITMNVVEKCLSFASELENLPSSTTTDKTLSIRESLACCTTTGAPSISSVSEAETNDNVKKCETDMTENSHDTDSKTNQNPDNAGRSNTEIGFKLPQLPLHIGKIGCRLKSKGTLSSNSTNSPLSPDPLDKVESNQSDKNVDQIAGRTTCITDQDQTDNCIAPMLPPKQYKLQQVNAKKPVADASDRVHSRNLADTDSFSSKHFETSTSTSTSECSSSKKILPSNSTNDDNKKQSKPSFSKLSPAEKLAQSVTLPYKEPSWSGVPQQPYHLEVLKGGAILSKIPLNEKSFLVFGRLESCDVMLEHPTLSRHHMVLQYRQIGDSDHDPGFYVYDLNSTHGSFLNKQQLKPRTYCHMRVGHMFKLAKSTRLYILQGPAEDQDAESELSVTQLKMLRRKQLEEQKKEPIEEDNQRQEEGERGITWGMGDDAADEDPTEENPFALMTQEEREAFYIKDPKKTLRGFFEREGFELEYDVDEKNTGHGMQYVCRIELPVDDTEGRPIVAEAAVSGKKKEVVVACALEACRILDAQGVLRQAKHESKKRKAKNWADDDYYDSDDDTFLDRTGEIEKKRTIRMKKAGVIKEEVETFASLTSKLALVEAEINQIDDEITLLKNANCQSSQDDSLDAFMNSIRSGSVVDKTKRAKLKIRKIELKKEQAKLMKMINIARPASLPKIKRQVDSSKGPVSGSSTTTSKMLPMIGSLKGRLGAKKFKFVMPVVKPVAQPAVSSTTEDVEEEEEEEEDRLNVPMETNTAVMQEDEAKDVIHDDSGDHPRVSSSADVRGGDQPSSTMQVRPLKEPKLPPGPTYQLGPQRGPHKGPIPPGPTHQLGPQRGPHKGPSKSDFQQFVSNMEEVTVPEMKKPIKAVAMETEDDVTDWIPPKDQTGDGRTSLNDKYGY